MRYTKWRHNKVVRNLHKKARRIGFDKVFGNFPIPRCETRDIEYRLGNQRTPNETNTPLNFDVLDDFERSMLNVIMSKLRIQFERNFRDDDFEPPF